MTGRWNVALIALATIGAVHIARDGFAIRRALNGVDATKQQRWNVPQAIGNPEDDLLLAGDGSIFSENYSLNRSSSVGELVEQSMSHEDDELLASLGITIGPFPSWNKSIPCFPLEPDWNTGMTQRKPTKTGILFVKPPKTGSTTAASVTLRIASKVAARHKDMTICKNRVQHSQAYKMGYDRRDFRNSILWTIVREPTSRVVSQYFHFHVSRRNKPPTDKVFIDFVKKRIGLLTSFQLNYLAFQKEYNNPAQMIEQIFQQYNLVGVMERFDESVVVLQMLLGLDATDVMYLSAKSSGGYDDGRVKKKCTLIQRSVVSTGMKEYFETDEWKAIIYWDAILHKAANRALDMRIDQLGRVEFERNLAKFKALREQVDLTCGANVKLPCTSSGIKLAAEKTDCIYDDMGCGFECMDLVDQRLASAS
ncbi:hypothetical protein MPSEU_000698500 [Mayamaea pseudoterrestris]|nr:hypothetical protein MPSEU_000698500 [Mayamaea pseudoterrestris]